MDRIWRFFVVSSLIIATALNAGADETGLDVTQASPERLAVATGHYARSRSLLIEAIREFDQGYEIARPDALLDSKEWRSIVTARAEDLERVIDPQPRLTKGGAKFKGDSRLLNVTRKK